jgi:hypothetical protein
MNILNLSYDVVKDVGREFGFKLVEDEECDWDLMWFDTYVQPNSMAKM